MITEIEDLRKELVKKVIELTGIDPLLINVDVSIHDQRNTSDIIKQIASDNKMEVNGNIMWYSTEEKNGSTTVFLGAE